MKIVINAQHGGFNLSEAQKTVFGEDAHYSSLVRDPLRTNPAFIASVEAGDTGGESSQLTVVEIPDGAFYVITEHAGYEWVYWSMSEIHTEQR